MSTLRACVLVFACMRVYVDGMREGDKASNQTSPKSNIDLVLQWSILLILNSVINYSLSSESAYKL